MAIIRIKAIVIYEKGVKIVPHVPTMLAKNPSTSHFWGFYGLRSS